eukprot:6178668-Pleurochrysis_carterae.AAC.1
MPSPFLALSRFPSPLCLCCVCVFASHYPRSRIQFFAVCRPRPALAQAVSVTHVATDEAVQNSPITRFVKERLVERACLLLHDVDETSCPRRADLRPEVADALQSGRISVGEVRDLKQDLSFGGNTFREKTKACVL